MKGPDLLHQRGAWHSNLRVENEMDGQDLKREGVHVGSNNGHPWHDEWLRCDASRQGRRCHGWLVGARCSSCYRAPNTAWFGPTGWWERGESISLTLDGGGGWWIARDIEVAWLNPNDGVSDLRWCSGHSSSSRTRFGSMTARHRRGRVLGVFTMRVKT
jgi:hypothetical protein